MKAGHCYEKTRDDDSNAKFLMYSRSTCPSGCSATLIFNRKTPATVSDSGPHRAKWRRLRFFNFSSYCMRFPLPGQREAAIMRSMFALSTSDPSIEEVPKSHEYHNEENDLPDVHDEMALTLFLPLRIRLHTVPLCHNPLSKYDPSC